MIATHDEWIAQARVFFLVSGIVEVTLRARLDARLSDKYGPDWLTVPGVVPSHLHDLAKPKVRDGQLARVHQLVEAASQDPTAAATLLTDLQAALQPPMPQPKTSAEFLQGLTLYGLLSFFHKTDLWDKQASLEEIFWGRNGTGPKIRRDKVLSVLALLHEARNEIMHFRPDKYFSLAQPLFDAAQMATWLGQDLQHIYESIDSRHSTELSIILTPLADYAGWLALSHQGCGHDDCKGHPPLDWLLERAPTHQEDLPTIPVRRGCLYHRVIWRKQLHH